jgi:hypothetical protein
MTEQRSKRMGRPPLPEGEGKLYALGLRTVLENYAAVNNWAAQSGRSVAQEVERSIEFRQAMEGAYPPEIAALLESIGHTMVEVGTSIAGANRWSGHGVTSWLGDPYAYNQAIDAAQHFLELTRFPGPAEPHGIFATPGWKTQAETIGGQIANGVVEVMAERHQGQDTTTTSQWARRVKERLGAIGARLTSHPPSPEYLVGASVHGVDVVDEAGNILVKEAPEQPLAEGSRERRRAGKRRSRED